VTAGAACGVLWALAVIAAALVRPAPRSAGVRRRDAGVRRREALVRASGASVGPREAPARHQMVLAIGLLVGAVLALALWPPLALGIAGGAALARRWRALRRQRARQSEIVETLPEVVDLVGLAATAGLTVPLMVRTLSSRAPPPFGVAFAAVVERSARGWRLADALAELPEQLGDPVRPLTAALVATERYGVGLLPALEHLGYDARRERRRRAEAAARRLPIRLSFPLVCCILPAFGLLTIAPLLAGALRSLHL